jgi:HSP20 family protein
MARDETLTGRTEPVRESRGGTPARRHESPRGSLRRYEPMWPSSFWETSPFSLMRRMTEEMDRMFGDVGFGRYGRDWPQVEAFQRGNEFVVRADLPGIKKDDINVELNDDSLTISGERRHEEKEEREGFYRSERSYGTFHRVVPLPDGTIAESANAQFKDGVLEITMQAPPEATRARRLEVKETK